MAISSAKVQCMYDHVKPKIRDMNTENIIPYVGTNDLNSEKTLSQIARSITGLAVSVKTNTNNIAISLIKPRIDDLNNKASEVSTLRSQINGFFNKQRGREIKRNIKSGRGGGIGKFSEI